MERNPEFNRRRQLVELAEAGHFTLPPEIVDAYKVATTVAAERDRRRVDPVVMARQDLLEATRAAAAGDAPWPDGSELVAAEAAQCANHERGTVLDQVLAEAQGNFVGTVTDLADAVIVEGIRPAVDEVLDQAGHAVALTAPHGGNQRALMTAPKAVRDAWLSLDELATRYSTLRSARALLARGVSHLDSEDLFAECRNMHEVWPSWRLRKDQPWPPDQRGRLAWLISSEAEPWTPTLAEQDGRFAEVFSDGLARAKRARDVSRGGRMPLAG